jgi:hypothetical protein
VFSSVPYIAYFVIAGMCEFLIVFNSVLYVTYFEIAGIIYFFLRIICLFCMTLATKIVLKN